MCCGETRSTLSLFYKEALNKDSLRKRRQGFKIVKSKTPQHYINRLVVRKYISPTCPSYYFNEGGSSLRPRTCALLYL